jgi:hypothetical protein
MVQMARASPRHVFKCGPAARRPPDPYGRLGSAVPGAWGRLLGPIELFLRYSDGAGVVGDLHTLGVVPAAVAEDAPGARRRRQSPRHPSGSPRTSPRCLPERQPTPRRVGQRPHRPLRTTSASIAVAAAPSHRSRISSLSALPLATRSTVLPYAAHGGAPATRGRCGVRDRACGLPARRRRSPW